MDDKLNLELGTYDIAMLFSLILLGRKHGDQQVYDWAGELRETLREKINEDKMEGEKVEGNE